MRIRGTKSQDVTSSICKSVGSGAMSLTRSCFGRPLQPVTTSALFSTGSGSIIAAGGISTGRGSPSNSRRRMGPPQRKPQSNEQNEYVGRVAVYCVGSALDLPALRAHVFRRGFGVPNLAMSPNAASAVTVAGDKTETVDDHPNRYITQTITSEADIDDEVLHVSNDPMQRLSLNLNLLDFIDGGDEWRPSNNNNIEAANSNDSKQDDDSSISNNSNNINNMNSNSDGLEDASQESSWKRRQLLLLARQDIYYFDYGCVVFWGLSPREERAALTELRSFTIEPCSEEEVEDSHDTMEYIYDRKANAQKPIRFDRIKLRTVKIEEKLAHSYAMAQSSKLFVFESRVLRSLETTRYLPKELARGGRINRSKKELNQLIGNLFVEQTEVNLFSSILDSPDFLWDDDQHKPAYDYIRAYLEVDDRVALLNSRLGVIRELLDVLNAQIADNNSERLEWM